MTGGVIALVTARGGSKRLPGKNLLPVAGKPLIAWTIETALAAPSVRRVIVSTDTEEIAALARRYGAEVPFMRPAALATDQAPHAAVVSHAVDWLSAAGDDPEYIVLLQPTSPTRTVADIEGGIALARSRNAASVVGVRPAVDHPFLCYRLDDAGRMTAFVDLPSGYLRTQDLPPAFAINGALYLVRPREFVEKQSFVTPETLAYVMAAEASVDVDDAEDLALAERLLAARTAKEAGRK